MISEVFSNLGDSVMCTSYNLFLLPLQNLTLQRSQGQSLQTARLPIREYMVKSMNTKNYYSETLAINQGEGPSPCPAHVLPVAQVAEAITS